jgi:hypothetical protein
VGYEHDAEKIHIVSKYEKQIKESLDNNIKLVMENGPGLYYGLRSHYVAKCHTGKHVLQGGLGCMGVGQMWGWSREYGKEDGKMREDLADVWDELPVQPCGDFGIDDVCGRK